MTPKSVEEEKIQRRLKRHVLQHLKENGPTNIDILYVHFDPNMSAHIAPVLQDLRRWKHIEFAEKNMVKITEAGNQLLENVNYWK